MKKKDILNSLRDRCTKDINLPTHLGLDIVQDQLTITLQGDAVITNMQADGSAFEGWALVIKRWMPEIKKVVIKWAKPESARPLEMQHYQRFLYRVKRFCTSYSWCELNKKEAALLADLLIDKGDKLSLNAPNTPRKRDFTTRKELYVYSESELEEFILSDKKVSESFKQTFNLQIVDNQLPIGVSMGAKGDTTKIFTGAKSAIDIWGINNDGDCCIFELKNSKNRKVGALTEMLFYSSIMNDVIKGVFEFTSLGYPGIKEISKAKNVKCYLLAPSINPLIDKGVFELLNTSKAKVDFGNVTILDNFSFTNFL